MKTFYLYIVLLLSLGCKAQEFDLRDMKRFDEKVFKDWEVNRQYVPIGDDKYFKKGNRRIQLLYDYNAHEVRIEESDTITPYTRWATYNLETESTNCCRSIFF